MIVSALSLVLAASVSACSPGLFFGGGTDQGVAKTPSYRKINVACSGLKLSSPQLDVPTFKQLLNCFNSQGAIQEVADLINPLPDRDVQAFVDVTNKYVLNNEKLLFELERTYYGLDRAGILKDSMTQFGKLLENEDFAAASVALLRDGYGGERQKDVLLALERLSKKLEPSSVGTGIDFALSLGSSAAFKSLEKAFSQPIDDGRLSQLVDGVLDYVDDSTRPGHPPLGERALELVANQEVFDVLDRDEVLGASPLMFGRSVPRLSSVMKVTLGNDGEIFDAMTSLFHYLNVPIQCMNRAKTVPNGDLHVIRELVRIPTTSAATFIKKTNKMTMATLSAFCEFPEQLARYYPAMEELADTPAIEPATDLIKAFFNEQNTGRATSPLVNLMIDFLADTGDDDRSGVKRLIPLLGELTNRNAWDDLLLMASLLRPENREKLGESIHFVIDPAPELGGRSLLDVLQETFSQAGPSKKEDVVRFVRGAGKFLDSSDPLLVPALTGLRKAFYANDVHPVIDLAREILADAPKNAAFFNVLFRIADGPRFANVIRLTSAMARDGRMRDLLGALVTLFHRFALRGKIPVHDLAIPYFDPIGDLWHNLSSADLFAGDDPFPIGSEPSLASNACRRIDLGLPFDHYDAGGYGEQMKNILACENSDGKHADVPTAVDFLMTEPTASGESFFDKQIDLVRKLGLDRAGAGYLTDRWMEAYSDGRFSRLIRSVPWWVSRKFQGASDSKKGGGPVLRPLLDIFPPIMSATRDELQRLEGFGASVLRRDDAPQLLGFLDDTVTAADAKMPFSTAADPAYVFEPSPRPPVRPYARERIKDWIVGKECDRLSFGAGSREREEETRTDEIIHDFENALTNWELVDGSVREKWDLGEFQKKLDWVFDKLTDPAQSVPERPALTAFLNVLRYFTLKPGQPRNQYQHYTPEDLRRWLYDRSTDYRPITYFYPGEKSPRVRLVNSLDRLELVLIISDFDAPIFHNLSLKFTGELADSWGDEPYAIWPDDIKRRFSSDPASKNYPPTLAHTVDEMLRYSNGMTAIGFPDLPECSLPDGVPPDPHTIGPGIPNFVRVVMSTLPEIKASVYNNAQVISVMVENLPKGPHDIGLRVLRDLFFELKYSTPPEYRNEKAGPRNNLSLATTLSRMGFLRQIGRNLLRFKRNDPALDQFFRALVAGGTSPEFEKTLKILLVNDQDEDRKLVKTVVRDIFSIFGAAEGEHPAPEFEKELRGKTPKQVWEIYKEWAHEPARLKQLAFYSLAGLEDLQSKLPPEQRDIIQGSLRTLNGILTVHRKFLSAHSDTLLKLLRSRFASFFLRALYQEKSDSGKASLAQLLRDAVADPRHGVDAVSILRAVSEDPKASHAYDVFSDRYDRLSENPDYMNLNTRPILKDILRFFEDRTTDPEARILSAQMRLFSADRMEKGDVDDLLDLMARKPNEFYQVLQTVAHYTDNGELEDFFSMIDRSLSEPPR